MDNVCHTLVGAALAETGLKRHTRYGSAALMISANLPDLDVLVFFTNTPPVSFRRGWTHGLLAQALLPLALAGAFWAWDRWREGSRKPEARSQQQPRLGWLAALGYLGVYSHVFLDYLNNYGVRLLTPFDWRWLYGDSVFIIDPWLWATLGFGVWLARRRERTSPARVAVVVAAVYIAGMLALAQDARRFVIGEWRSRTGQPPGALMVGPVPVVPWTREVIIDTGDAYRVGRYTAWPRRVELDEEPIPKNDQLEEVAAARHSPQVAGFLVWSRFPFWTVTPSADGTTVVVEDVRFPVSGNRFSATTVVPPAVTEP
jgi:inner membrane protein